MIKSTKMQAALITTILLLSIALTILPVSAAVTVGPTPTTGPVGTPVTVSGNSTTPGGLIQVYWDTVKAWDGTAGYLASDYATGLTYSIKITIPAADAGLHYVIVKDVEATEIASTEFTVTAKIVLSPTKGVVDDTITVTGTGFAAGSTITFSGISGISTVPATVTTSVLGSFTCTFKIPLAADATYTITATDTVNSATAPLTVGKYITLTPTKGLVGTTVTVAGRGFAKEGTVDIRWYMAPELYITLVDDAIINVNGDFSTTFTVPLVPDPSAPGAPYTVEAIDSEDESVVATFTVVKSATITLTPKSGKAGTSVTVTGTWFTATKTVTFTFGGITLTTTATTNAVGAFTATFTVPTVAAGSYTVRATDATGVSASATFTVPPPPTIVIETRATEYRQGDVISISGKCSEAPATAVLVITDPTGIFFWGADLDEGDWVEVNGWDVLPYLYGGDMLPLGLWPLPADAPLGDWNFAAYESFEWETQEGTGILDTNLFTVVAPTLQAILDRLDDLELTVTGFITDAEGNILLSLDAINATIVSIDGDVATIKTDAGLVKANVSTIRGYFPVDVAVDMTPTWIAVVLSLIAAAAAGYAALQITRKIAG